MGSVYDRSTGRDAKIKRVRSKKDRGPGLSRNMAEPELKSRSSREDVAKAASRERMEGRWSAR